MSISYQDPIEGEAFEQVNNLLQDGNSQTDVLLFKNTELQKIVQTLTITNQKLISRIQELQEMCQRDKQSKSDITFNEDYSVLQGDFGYVEDMIKEYRNQLQTYQNYLSSQLQQKTKIIVDLQTQNEELSKQNQNYQHQISDLQLQNQMLQTTKEGLLSQIDELQSSLRKSKHDSSKYNHRYGQNVQMSSHFDSEGYNGSDFGISVQHQLQKLIQKLVKELEHERGLKKKLLDQIRQLRKQVLQQEKQIIQKNNAIYQLQINAIKSNKMGINTRGNGREHEGIDRQEADARRDQGQGRRDWRRGRRDGPSLSPNTSVGERITSKRKNFTMMQLMNECVLLSSKEKLVITLKMIDLFSKKYQNEDYSSEILQSILITNYNQNNAHLCQIKINPAVQKDHDVENETQQQLVWNLVFILDSLLMQMGSRDRQVGQTDSQSTLLQAIGFFLENKNENSIDSVIQLRKIAEQALNDHLR